MDAHRKQNNMTFLYLCTDKKNCNAITTIQNSSQQPAIATTAINCNIHSFLALLHNVLSFPGFNDTITWQQHGLAWNVLDQLRFSQIVVSPACFNMTLDDFYKSLDMWGFKVSLL